MDALPERRRPEVSHEPLGNPEMRELGEREEKTYRLNCAPGPLSLRASYEVQELHRERHYRVTELTLETPNRRTLDISRTFFPDIPLWIGNEAMHTLAHTVFIQEPNSLERIATLFHEVGHYFHDEEPDFRLLGPNTTYQNLYGLILFMQRRDILPPSLQPFAELIGSTTIKSRDDIQEYDENLRALRLKHTAFIDAWLGNVVFISTIIRERTATEKALWLMSQASTRLQYDLSQLAFPVSAIESSNIRIQFSAEQQDEIITMPQYLARGLQTYEKAYSGQPLKTIIASLDEAIRTADRPI